MNFPLADQQYSSAKYKFSVYKYGHVFIIILEWNGLCTFIYYFKVVTRHVIEKQIDDKNFSENTINSLNYTIQRV